MIVSNKPRRRPESLDNQLLMFGLGRRAIFSLWWQNRARWPSADFSITVPSTWLLRVTRMDYRFELQSGRHARVAAEG